MPAPVLQFKRGNAGVAGTVPALRPGEPAISLNNFDFFIGIDTSVANNKFFGSHRYWGREDGTNSLNLKLVDKDGTNYVAIKAPNTLGGNVTYTLPGTQGATSTVLTNDGSGNLSWASGSSNPVFTGIATFTDTTDNTLGDANTGAVQIDGGLGINKNVTVGAGLSVVDQSYFLGTATFYNNAVFINNTNNNLGNYNTGAVQIEGGLGVQKNLTVGAGLSVGGQSYFIGTATFYGGTINLGDSDTDDIVIAGEFKSSLIPSDDATYDIGNGGASKRWRNASFSGIGTFTTGLVADNVRLGIGGNGVIDTTSGVLYLDSAAGTTVVNDNLNVIGDIDVSGNVFIGGTSVTLRSEDVFIQNKDIVLGYTTSITPNDDTANHAGVAIASTVGTPLASFAASGINTLPDTYKQLMWFRTGTLGFSTDAFAFNYGVAIGTTTMASGVRLAVGSGVTIGDTTVTASTFYGSVVGNVSSADQVKTVTAGNTNATYHITFVDSNNGSATNETVYTDDGIYYNPGTNTFTTQNALFTGNVTVDGTLTGTATTATRATTVDVVGVATNQNYYITLVDGSGNAKSVGVDAELLYNPNTNTLTVGTGVGITQFSGSVSTGNSTSSVPTSSAIIDYVNATDIGIAGDSGTGTVNTTQTLTINGTASEIETSASGQTITVGLPNAVVVGTSLSAPTLRTGTIQSSDTGATAITITTNDVTVADDLTVQGNLYVNGSTTQVNTTSITVEDRTIEMGVVDGSAPSSATTWDLGVLFNYYTDSAKKSAVVWEHSDSRFKFASVLAADSNGTNNNTPQLTVTTFAPIEVGSLWVTDCAGTSQVISCTGTERFLENITVDAGLF